MRMRVRVWVRVRVCWERNRKLQAKDVGIYDKSPGNVLLTTHTATNRKSLSRSDLALLVSQVWSFAPSYRLPLWSCAWKTFFAHTHARTHTTRFESGRFFNTAKRTRTHACVIALCLHLSAINFVNECIIAFLCTPRSHLGPRPTEIIAKEFKWK